MKTNDTPTRPHSDAEPFGPVIYAYTRAQAVADGQQVEGNRPATPCGVRGAAGRCMLHGASEPADC